MPSDLLGGPLERRASILGASIRGAVGGLGGPQWRAPDRLDDMGFSRAGQGLMISTVTVASP